MPSQFKRPGRSSAARPRLEDRLADEAHFIRTWLDKPKITGAVSPSGRFLAHMMARAVETKGTAPIIELGPGTGPITQALLKRGIDPKRLVLVEFDSSFCRLLRQRFPAVRVVQGDAYALRESLKGELAVPAAAVVSSLPLLNKPDAQRLSLIDDAFSLMEPGGSFVQFTYGMTSPVPRAAATLFDAQVSPPVWLNLPPARVWIYRRKGETPPNALDLAPRDCELSPRDAKRLGLRTSETGLFRPAAFRPERDRVGLFRKRPNPFIGTLRD